MKPTKSLLLRVFDKRISAGEWREIVGFTVDLLQPRRETLEMVVRSFPRGETSIEQATFPGPACAPDAGRHAGSRTHPL